MKRILVGVDGSEESKAAARFAANLAAETGAKLTVAAIAYLTAPLAEPEFQVRMRDGEERELGKLREVTKAIAAELARPDLAVDTLVEKGLPASALAEIAARDDVDLVVVGHRGRGAVKRVLLGSVADRLVQICSKPVTVVH